MKHWTKKFFLDEDSRWLELMNRQWSQGAVSARQIVGLLKKHGLRTGRLVEAGCGNGRVLIPLAKKGFSVLGVDFNPVYIEDARKRARHARARAARVKADFVLGDMRRLDTVVRGRFDAVLSIWTAIGYYGKKSDQTMFTRIGRLLKPGGLFLILQTMSEEYLLNHRCPGLFEETDRYLIIHTNTGYDRFQGVIRETWAFYEKVGRDLKYCDEFTVELVIYSHSALVEMARRAGLEFVAAYDNLGTLETARSDSRINIVFRKP